MTPNAPSDAAALQNWRRGISQKGGGGRGGRLPRVGGVKRSGRKSKRNLDDICEAVTMTAQVIEPVEERRLSRRLA